MPYPDLMIHPMREELKALGFESLETPEQVDTFFSASQGTAMLVINSVCGCAAGAARPAAALSLQSEHRPDRLATVFAGQDTEATDRARSYFSQLPPSSPSIILIRDNAITHYIPRHRIEGRASEEIAADLIEAFKQLKEG